MVNLGAIPLDAPPARSTEGRLIYAVGDVHGRYDLMLNLLAKIIADSRSEPSEKPPLLIFLGDYIDRGPGAAKAALLYIPQDGSTSNRHL